MKKLIYHKNNIVKMIADEKLPQHGTMEEVELDITDEDFKKVGRGFLIKYDGKKLIFEPILNPETQKELLKEQLKNATTIGDLKQIIQKVI